MGLLDKLFGGGGDDESAEPQEQSKTYRVGQRTCQTCERRMLAGATECPFCQPQDYGEDVEATLQVSFQPGAKVGSLGGVVMAQNAAREHHALGFLHVFEGPSRGATILVAERPVHIGRKGGQNQLALADNGASAQHCEVRFEDGGLVIVDAGSKNGTFVNDVRIEGPQRLEDGDVLGVNESRIYVGVL